MPPALVNLKSVTLDDAALRYLDTQAKGTKVSYEKCLRRFVYFYEGPFSRFLGEIEEERDQNKTLPIEARKRPGEETIRKFIEWHLEIGYSNYSTLQSIGAIQNALKYYGVPVSMAFIKTPPPTPKKENDKHEWTLDQIRQFAESAEYLRDKAYILFAFQSGLSIGDILDLNYGDIRREYEAGATPLSIKGYRQKTKVPIRTFIGRDALHYLRLYLQSRPHIKNGAPLFTLLGANERATPNSIQKKLRDYAGKLEFIFEEDMEGYSPVRPHSLRSGFRSRLTGKMDGDLIEFFMAHELGQSQRTYMNQPLDELREIYESYEHLISVYKTSRQEREEQSRETIPESTMKDIRDQGAKISELEANLNIKGERIAQLEANMKVKNDQLAEFEAKLTEVDSVRMDLAELRVMVQEKLADEP